MLMWSHSTHSPNIYQVQIMLNARNAKCSKQVQLKETACQEMLINNNNLGQITSHNTSLETGQWGEKKLSLLKEKIVNGISLLKE